jgi:hypothetical protein
MAARVPQIVSNFSTKNTGQVGAGRRAAAARRQQQQQPAGSGCRAAARRQQQQQPAGSGCRSAAARRQQQQQPGGSSCRAAAQRQQPAAAQSLQCAAGDARDITITPARPALPLPLPQLSLATNAINLLGCLVRIFTTIQEKAGAAMLYGFLIGGPDAGAGAAAAAAWWA